MAKINDLPLLSNPTEDMYCLVGKDDLQKVPWSAIMGQIGAPYIATTAAGMTDKTRVYVYQGSESGYTSGNWYYWNGSAWTSGGTYNSAAVDTDKTLTQSDKAADSAIVGQQIGELKESLDDKFSYSDNIFSIENIAENKYVTRLGTIADHNGWNLSDFLPVESNETYKWKDAFDGKYIGNIYYGLYNASREWIGCGTTEASNFNDREFIKTDEYTKYIRVSGPNTGFTEKAMICKKTIWDNGVTEYIPYNLELRRNTTYATKKELNNTKGDIEKSMKSAISKTGTIDLEKIQDEYCYIVNDNGYVERKNVQNYSVAVVDCEELKEYVYSGVRYNYSNQYSIIVTNANGKVLLKTLGATTADTTQTKVTESFKTPEGSKKIYLSSYHIKNTDDVLSLKGDVIYNNLGKDFQKFQEEVVPEKIKYTIPNYDNVIRSIQRIGDGMDYPHHTLDAFKDAYKKGFRILLCDLIFTKDNIAVCNHDSYLNENYKDTYDSDGNLVSTDQPIYIGKNTYETLSKYNYGGMGYPLLKFTDMLKLVRKLGVELYIEIKGMNESQAKIACDLVKKFDMVERTSWVGTSTSMKWIINDIDTARVSTMPKEITDDVISKMIDLKTEKNKVFIFGWDTTILTQEIVDKLITNDIAFEQGTLHSAQEIVDYFKRGDEYYYCTGIETNSLISGKVLLEDALNS